MIFLTKRLHFMFRCLNYLFICHIAMLFLILTVAVGFTSIKMGHNCTGNVVSILVRLVLIRYKIAREGCAKSWFYHVAAALLDERQLEKSCLVSQSGSHKAQNLSNWLWFSHSLTMNVCHQSWGNQRIQSNNQKCNKSPMI